MLMVYPKLLCLAFIFTTCLATPDDRELGDMPERCGTCMVGGPPARIRGEFEGRAIANEHGNGMQRENAGARISNNGTMGTQPNADFHAESPDDHCAQSAT